MDQEYREQVKFELETEDEEFYNHTYHEERRILYMVRMG